MTFGFVVSNLNSPFGFAFGLVGFEFGFVVLNMYLRLSLSGHRIAYKHRQADKQTHRPNND